MSAIAPATRSRNLRPMLIAVSAVLAATLLWFIVQKIHYLTDYSLASYSDYYWPRRIGLIPHLIGGILAITSGLVQITLCVAWVTTTGMALYAIRTGRIEQHQQWMLRSYTVTFAFVTFRLVEIGLRRRLAVPQGAAIDDIDTLLAWGCWAVPLLLAEPLIQIRSMRQ
jgi:hypothetical protein